jgi:hypothetical protein
MRYGDNDKNEDGFYKESSFVVQKYIKQPALWKGHKFDFRIYVLLLSVIDPM